MGECWRGPCFACKEMFCGWVIPSRGSRILGTRGLSDPLTGSPPVSSFSSLLMKRADIVDATSLGRSSQHGIQLPPQEDVGSMWNLRWSVGLRMEVSRWFLLDTAEEQTGVGLVLINLLLQGQRPPVEPWHLHMCVLNWRQTPRAGWVGLLFTETTGSTATVNNLSLLRIGLLWKSFS